MPTHYRKKVANLRAALSGDKEHARQAIEIVRSLIDRIVLAPTETEAKKVLSITLEGHIASILAMAAKAKAPLHESDASLRVKIGCGGTQLA
jgi:site-specific DNA recombinase